MLSQCQQSGDGIDSLESRLLSLGRGKVRGDEISGVGEVAQGGGVVPCGVEVVGIRVQLGLGLGAAGFGAGFGLGAAGFGAAGFGCGF